MLDVRQCVHRLLAHALRGTVGSDQVWMGGFQLLQPLDQLIVLPVADFGLRLGVIFPIVVANLFAKLFDFLGGGHGNGPE